MASLNGRFMRDSAPEQIIAKVREYVDIMGRDGRLLLWIGNVPADTPPLNVHTAVKATRTLGKYPIAQNLSKIMVDPPQFKPFDEWLKGQPEEEYYYESPSKYGVRNYDNDYTRRWTSD
jgi:hypothetical protein